MTKFSFIKTTLIATLLGAGAVSVPVQAAKSVDLACNTAMINPVATACAGFFSGNLLSNSTVDAQKTAIASLPGDFVFDGNWDALDPEFKIESLSNVNQLNFGKTLYGMTIIGAHFGNVTDGAKGTDKVTNVSVFWLFDAKDGMDSVTLANTQGFSNAVLYTTGAVPEPATWLMMLLGFGAIGYSMRRKQPAVRAQFA